MPARRPSELREGARDAGIVTPVETMYLLVLTVAAVAVIGFLGRLHAAGVETTAVAQAAAHNAELPLRVADDFLRATALALLDWAWQRIAAAPQADPGRWQAPAAALADWVLPEFDMRVQIMRRALAAHAAVAA